MVWVWVPLLYRTHRGPYCRDLRDSMRLSCRIDLLVAMSELLILWPSTRGSSQTYSPEHGAERQILIDLHDEVC